MIRFLFDEDLHNGILRGLRRRSPEMTILRVQDTTVATASDTDVLAFAAAMGLIVVTHDSNTMTLHAKKRVEAGMPMPGLIVIRQSIPIGKAIDDLLLVAEVLQESEWQGQIHFLPL